MKKLLFIVFAILFSLSAIAAPPPITIEGAYPDRDITFHGDVFIDDDGIPQEIATKTTQNFTLFVRTTGDDTNDCITEPNACLTIPSAISRIPDGIGHTVEVDIGTGSFAVIHVEDKIIGTDGSLDIHGTLGNPTLGGGTVSGTATGGSTVLCTDAGQAWVVNALRGMLVLVNGEYRVIQDNDATNINLVGPLGGTCNGEDYELFEQKTTITGTSPYGYGPISVVNTYETGANGIVVRDVKTTSGVLSVIAARGGGVKFERVHITGSTYGIFIQAMSKAVYVHDCYVEGSGSYDYYLNYIMDLRSLERSYSYNGSTGFFISGCFALALNNNIAEDNSADGYFIASTQFANLGKIESLGNTGDGIKFKNENDYVSISSGLIDNNGGAGINIHEKSTTNIEIETCTISNNTNNGILANNTSNVILNTVVGSSTGYGLVSTTGATAIVTTNTAITGATADATINGGATDLTWATHLAANGDIVVNLDNLCRIERRD